MKPSGTIIHLLLPSTLILLISCAGRDAGQPAPETIENSISRLRGCVNLSAEPYAEDDQGVARLAVRSIEHLTDGTLLHLVAYAGNEPVNFALPLYSLSRGRWLLENFDRVYLVDQNCREYRLNDVDFPNRRAKPGLILIQADHAVEGTIRFPTLNAAARFGVLIYGKQRIPVFFSGNLP